MRRVRGFTLLELLLVLILIGIGTSLAVNSVQSLTGRSTDTHWSDRTLLTLRKLRNQAILREKPVQVRIDAARGEIWTAENRVLTLPMDYHFQLDNRNLSAQTETELQLTFSPDGSVTPGRFVLVMPTGAAEFRLQAVSGRIDRKKIGRPT